jgi:phosphoribosylformylglycinamidine (FGAM) synthase-like amidotransferase family enzyme
MMQLEKKLDSLPKQEKFTREGLLKASLHIFLSLHPCGAFSCGDNLRDAGTKQQLMAQIMENYVAIVKRCASKLVGEEIPDVRGILERLYDEEVLKSQENT